MKDNEEFGKNWVVYSEDENGVVTVKMASKIDFPKIQLEKADKIKVLVPAGD